MKRHLFTFVLLLLSAFATKAVSPSGTLPVLYINTENNQQITSKENYVKATYYLEPNNVEGIEAIGSKAKPLDLQIRGRGNYTWTGFDKKPYRLKLGKKQALLGMNKSKHWALLAHADDSRAFLRNTVGFQLSRMAGLPWTPGDVPVEVVLNGDYIGLYFLTETVRVDKDRVNVWDYDSAVEDYEEANPGQTLPWEEEYATGGWLCEIDNYDDEDQIKFRSQDKYVPDKTLRITYDTPSDYITEAHKAWLINEFKVLDDVIVNGDREICAWQEKIDITNLARFFVVNQIVFNYESFHGSCKLSHDIGALSKWNFGPVWDFGSAFQTRENKMFYDYGVYSNHWIKTMMEYPTFVTEVKRVYAELMDNDFDAIYTYIDNFISHIGSAAASDLQRWPQYGNSGLTEKANGVKAMLRESITYLDNVWRESQIDPIDPRPESDIYLRGNFTNWEARPEYIFTETSKNIFELHLDHLSESFKLAGPVWGVGNVDYGYEAPIAVDRPTVLTWGGENITLAEGELDNVTLTFDWSTKTLTISTSQEEPEVETYTVYYHDNIVNPWTQVYVFTWNDQLNGAWPGEPMELVVNDLNPDMPLQSPSLSRQSSDPSLPSSINQTSDSQSSVNPLSTPTHNVWSYTFTATKGLPTHGITGIIFNNGKSGVAAGNQTEDFVFYKDKEYDRQGTLSVSELEIDENAPVEYYNLQGIRVDNPSNGIFIRRQGNNVKKVSIR